MNQEMRLDLFNSYNGYCQCCPECVEKATDLHHIKPNTKVSKEKFPLFIDSPFNLVPLANGCHLWKKLPKPPSDIVCKIYENFLEGLKECKN